MNHHEARRIKKAADQRLAGVKHPDKRQLAYIEVKAADVLALCDAAEPLATDDATKQIIAGLRAGAGHQHAKRIVAQRADQLAATAAIVAESEPVPDLPPIAEAATDVEGPVPADDVETDDAAGNEDPNE